MSATDELRRLLDERGVEWEDNSPVPSMKQWKTSFMSFTGEEVTLSCYDEPKWIMGTLVFHTPEQAIAATIGHGTCHVMTISEFNGEGTEYYAFCSNCGYEFDDDPLNYCPNCGRRIEVDDG